MSVTALLLAQSETASDTVGSISENTLGDIGLAIIGIIASLVAGYFATSALKHRNFDSLFVPPWKPLFQTESQQQPWPISTWLGRAIAATGMLFVFTFLQHRPVAETSSRILQVVNQGWLLAVTVLIGLAIARVVAAAVISIFDNPTVRTQLEAFFPHNAGPARKTAAASADPALPPEPFADTIARLIGLFLYLIVFLPVFMVAAEVWGWTATGNAAGEIWRWLLPFVGLSATILIGWFALAATAMSLCPAEYRRPVLVGVTILALVLLAASYNTIFAVICGLVLIAIAWYARHDLPDFFAGMYLKTKSVITLSTEIGKAEVEEVQMLTSEVHTERGMRRVRNRLILRSFLDGQTIEEKKLVRVNPEEEPPAAAAEPTVSGYVGSSEVSPTEPTDEPNPSI